MLTEYILVLCTAPDKTTAAQLAETLVVERLAACVNLLPAVSSIYAWEGQIEKAEEQMLIIKTTNQLYEELESRIKASHPYEIPEIIAIPIAKGSTDYLQWMAGCLK